MCFSFRSSRRCGASDPRTQTPARRRAQTRIAAPMDKWDTGPPLPVAVIRPQCTRHLSFLSHPLNTSASSHPPLIWGSPIRTLNLPPSPNTSPPSVAITRCAPVFFFLSLGPVHQSKTTLHSPFSHSFHTSLSVRLCPYGASRDKCPTTTTNTTLRSQAMPSLLP